MNTLKKIAVAVASCGALLAATGAQAKTEALTFTDGNAYFGNAIGSGLGSFDDFFTFTLGTGSDVVADTIASFRFGSALVDITLFQLENVGGVVGAGLEMPPIGGFLDNWATFGAALPAGLYSLHVVGTVDVAKGGAYGGTMTITPVPEPETYAMMLAGLGIMGFMARRRRI